MSAANAIFGACLAATVATASAADSVGTLSGIEGHTFVSQGAQYVKGRVGMKLMEGDRLMAMEGGSAVVSFVDGCRYELTENELLSVGPVSSCALSSTAGAYKVDPYHAVSQDSSAAAANLQQILANAKAQAGVYDDDDDDDRAIGWIVPATAGGLVILGATLETTGGGSRRSRGGGLSIPGQAISP